MLIERHNRIISFSKNIEKLISFIALMQVVLDTLIICGLGFFAIIGIHNEMGVFVVTKTIFAIALILAEVFIICFTGEHLNYKSKSIINAAYELPWYDISLHQSKMLILIIMRSQKQLTISAGKMMDMSFETYTNIIKTSVSYISVMNALY
ncbi:PREDICTED: odorant receptor 13a-like [Atta cephalotes]|uniref:Odorant receptor n=1 Tax=Atta cephalotes TaxID=12957 RepID=A0A158P075_ATTCE|nr:PREDICTED: odorant receptor 13a-like [Atta cephalotes]